MAQQDVRCAPESPLPGDGAELLFTTRFGALLDTPPAAIDANDAITLSLVVRTGGTRQLAILDASSLTITTNPPTPLDIEIAGDGKFVTFSPKGAFAAAADGTVTVTAQATYLENFQRAGLALSGGSAAGTVSATMQFTLNDVGSAFVQVPGAASSTWDVTRLSVPLPTVMPSYNQIGFDQLHYLVGTVEPAVAWMIGGTLDANGNTIPDPTSEALFPLAMTVDGSLVTFTNQDGLTVEVMSLDMPFDSFRMSVHLGSGGDAMVPAVLDGSTTCANVPMYGAFLETLGLCNPQTDLLTFFGAANFTHHDPGPAPSGVGTVTFAATPSAVTATLAGSQLVMSQHVESVLLVDGTTGLPITLSYGLGTTRTANGDGTLATVSVPLGSVTLPATVRAYLMIDTQVAAMQGISMATP